MNYKKSKIDTNTVTRDVEKLEENVSNLYQSVVIIAKRANQIGLEMKEELNNKLSEFISSTDNLEEVFENREQIEIAKYYEQFPKPILVAIHEFMNDQVYFRVPEKQE